MSKTSYHFTVRRTANATLVQETKKGHTTRLKSYTMDTAQFEEWLSHTRSNGHTVDVKINGQPAYN